MTNIFTYKKFNVIETPVQITFGNGDTVFLFQITDKEGNIIHRACQWGDYCYTKNKAKSIINNYINLSK